MTKKILTIILALCLVQVFFTQPADSEELTTLSGKVTTGTEKTPVAGVRVRAWPVTEALFDGEAPHLSQETAENGLFQLSMPPGEYYIFAQGSGLFAFYGRNPVTVTGEGLADMNLSLVEISPPPVAAQPRVETGFIGRLSYNGDPLEGAVVTVYADSGHRFRGMGLGMTAPTDASGLFEAPLPPGEYFLVARKRNSGDFQGPLQPGDYFGFYPGNPFKVKEGEIVDASFAVVEVPAKADAQAASLFGETRINGTVRDEQGRPVAGMKVMLYGDPTMIQRPLYVSQPTNEEGQFVLSFPRGGRYWLVARDQLGGQPLPGQFYGRYLVNQDGSVYIKTGQRLENIVITGEVIQ